MDFYVFDVFQPTAVVFLFHPKTIPPLASGQLFQVGTYALVTQPHVVSDNLLVHLYVQGTSSLFYAPPRTSYFSKEPWFLFRRNGIKKTQFGCYSGSLFIALFSEQS